MAEDKLNLPIDKFNAIASWMDGVNRKLADLEARLDRLVRASNHDDIRIKALETYTRSLQVVMQPPEIE